MLKSLFFIVIGWDPSIKKRVNYLSGIEGRGFERLSLYCTKCCTICWSIIKYLSQSRLKLVLNLLERNTNYSSKLNEMFKIEWNMTLFVHNFSSRISVFSTISLDVKEISSQTNYSVFETYPNPA